MIDKNLIEHITNGTRRFIERIRKHVHWYHDAIERKMKRLNKQSEANERFKEIRLTATNEIVQIGRKALNKTYHKLRNGEMNV